MLLMIEKNAARLLERGYRPLIVPQMFGMTSGYITLYKDDEEAQHEDGMRLLEEFEQVTAEHSTAEEIREIVQDEIKKAFLKRDREAIERGMKIAKGTFANSY